jgi:hypothetical protein
VGIGGVIGHGGPGQVGAPFGGSIDEVSLYSRALSAAEILAIYNAGTAGKCAPAGSGWPGSSPPTISPDGGPFSAPAEVTLAAAEPATFCYSTDDGLTWLALPGFAGPASLTLDGLPPAGTGALEAYSAAGGISTLAAPSVTNSATTVEAVRHKLNAHAPSGISVQNPPCADSRMAWVIDRKMQPFGVLEHYTYRKMNSDQQ